MTKPKKVSRAAALRRLAEIQQERTQPPRQLSDAAEAVLDSYETELVTAADLAVIRPFIRSAIEASTVTGPESIRKHFVHLATLAGFALERGRDLDIPSLMTTAFIDEFITHGLVGKSDRVRAQRRTHLLALARHVNPGPTVPPRLMPLAHASIKPCYTPGELATFLRLCKTQPTPAKARDLGIVVGLGAGAGADSIDLRPLYVEHVEDLGKDGISVHFQGPRPRIVPVRATCELTVRRAIAGRKPSELLLGQQEDRKNTVARAIDAASLYGAPPLLQARLRATWLSDLMTDAVPIGVILQAAGLLSARSLAELLPHLDSWLEHKGLTPTPVAALRGGAA